MDHRRIHYLDDYCFHLNFLVHFADFDLATAVVVAAFGLVAVGFVLVAAGFVVPGYSFSVVVSSAFSVVAVAVSAVASSSAADKTSVMGYFGALASAKEIVDSALEKKLEIVVASSVVVKATVVASSVFVTATVAASSVFANLAVAASFAALVAAPSYNFDYYKMGCTGSCSIVLFAAQGTQMGKSWLHYN